ncbi:regulator of microtubule dynamics protein 1-like [Ornithodoros turicata]|uniref:Regulator of microtubule dynamics protein 1 n=1 Tax=Ornithodoros turicata TaxID=34597 RepID=A0A2R5LLW5_9ACAR
MDGLMRDKLTMIAALGTGVVVGISGIYLYYKLNRSVTRELTNLAGTIADLRREIELLKSSEEPRSSSSSTTVWKKGAAKKVAVNGSIRKQEAQELTAQPSSSSLDDDSEEYFDFTDVEDIENSWTGLKTKEDVQTDVAADGTGDQVRPKVEDKWLDLVDSKLDEPGDKEDLYSSMKMKQQEYGNNADYLWRMAKVTHLCGITAQKNGQISQKKELAFEAFGYAKDALAADDKNPEVHKWYAITIGSLSEFIGVQEKIRNGYEFKEHVDTAVRLKPSDPTLHHMLGRWCFEVATLTWIERKLASTLYSAPPQSTMQEARAHLFNADKLKNNWKENMLFIAKTYVCEGNYSPAISWVDRALAVPLKGEGDEVAQRELVTLMQQYQRYRS